MIPISDDHRARRPAAAYIWELSRGREMNAALAVLGLIPALYFLRERQKRAALWCRHG